MSRVKRDVMSVVKDERANDERCGQPVVFMLERVTFPT